ncbi:deoxyribodipyrimidine photo-lyase, partial [Acinetobacter baumannii]
PENYWPGGEIIAHQRLAQFVKEKIGTYHLHRDMPAQRATSKISAYLANGVLSPRQCFSAAMTANKSKLQSGFEGIDTWVNELIWREFYKQ